MYAGILGTTTAAEEDEDEDEDEEAELEVLDPEELEAPDELDPDAADELDPDAPDELDPAAAEELEARLCRVKHVLVHCGGFCRERNRDPPESPHSTGGVPDQPGRPAAIRSVQPRSFERSYCLNHLQEAEGQQLVRYFGSSPR